MSNATEVRTIAVPDEVTVAKHTYGPQAEGGVMLQTADGYALRLHSRHQGRETSFALTFINAAQGARRVHGGPVIHEDYAFLTALPIVISAHPQSPVTKVAAAVGDRVVFAGRVWEIAEGGVGYDPELKLVETL